MLKKWDLAFFDIVLKLLKGLINIFKNLPFAYSNLYEKGNSLLAKA